MPFLDPRKRRDRETHTHMRHFLRHEDVTAEQDTGEIRKCLFLFLCFFFSFRFQSPRDSGEFRVREKGDHSLLTRQKKDEMFQAMVRSHEKG